MACVLSLPANPCPSLERIGSNTRAEGSVKQKIAKDLCAGRTSFGTILAREDCPYLFYLKE